MLDFSAVYNSTEGMTRTVSLGKATSLQRRVFDIVLRAQEAALEAIAPGTGQEIDGIARGIIEEAGYGDNFDMDWAMGRPCSPRGTQTFRNRHKRASPRNGGYS